MIPLLLLTVLVWAGSFVFIKLALSAIDPFNLAFYRFLIATPLLYVVTYSLGRLEAPKNEDIAKISILALSGVTLLYVVQFVALEYTSATNAAVLINTSAIFVALAAPLMGERISRLRLAGVVLSFVGVAVTASHGSLRFSTSVVGDALMVLDGLLWAIYTLLGKELLEKYDALSLTSHVFAIGTIFLLPFAIIGGLKNPLEFGFIVVVSLLYLSVLCSVFAYAVWYLALERMEASRVAVFVYLIPVATAAIEYPATGSIESSTLVGSALVLAGVYLAERY